MTTHEARTIATLRMHFGCSFSKLAGIARAVWGEDHCREISGGKYSYGSPLGHDLVMRMEETLGLERCESDDMTMAELVCLHCKHTQWSICYPSDAEKECGNCGKMAAVFSANTKDQRPD